MAGFIYDGQSTSNFLMDELVIAFDNAIDDFPFTRDKQQGNTTISRTIANEYGVIPNIQPISMTLVKCSKQIITQDEQILIERWLTSPKLSQKLQFFPTSNQAQNGPFVYYYGIFTQTHWIPEADGFGAVKLTFTPTTPYPYMQDIRMCAIDGKSEYNIMVDTTEMYQNIYPTLKIDKIEQPDLQFTNESNGQTMKFTNLTDYQSLTVDCRNCLVCDQDGNMVKLYKIGWTSATDICWMSLIPRHNNLVGKGKCNITISYESPYKKVGVWAS